MEFDPFAEDVAADPYPHYARLRRESPLYWSEQRHIWILTRFDDVVALTRNTADFSSSRGRDYSGSDDRMLILTDPPQHSQMRHLVSKVFTPRRVAEMEPRIQEITDELLSAALARGAFDLVADLAYPLPTMVIAEILGVPVEDRADFKRWSDDVITAASLPEQPVGGRSGHLAMTAYFERVIKERRQAPKEDLISGLVAASDAETTGLSAREVVNFCNLLLIAGNETTTNLLSNAMAALQANPAECAKVRTQPSLVPALVEEALRFDGPVQYIARMTTREVEVLGQTIERGTWVFLYLASADRDEARFPDPDRFWIERPDNDHIAFGLGPHFCLGAPLARLEAQVALRTLFQRLPGLAADPARPASRHPSSMLRGFQRMPLLMPAISS